MLPAYQHVQFELSLSSNMKNYICVRFILDKNKECI